jgi:hypothetical protein
MTYYSSDRKFTDFVHAYLAIPLIYNSLNWKPILLEADEARKIDVEIGVDYVFESNEKRISVQERFRDKKYVKYNDFTIRYEREFSTLENQVKSEFYKMKADYFVYGIINQSKEEFIQATDFLKFAVIDMKKIYQKIQQGDIIIENNRHNYCYAKGKKLYCPIKQNPDKSSSFFPIDVQILLKLWGSEMILMQKGFVI